MRRYPGNRWAFCRRKSFICGALALLFPLSASVADAAPSWWQGRGVIDTNAPVTDYSPVVLGQLKWMAAKASDELEEHLPGGAGTEILNLVGGFSNTNNWNVVNAGQLKATAEPFYDRLIAEGYTNQYPWTATSTDDVDYALANAGQLKYLFDFDLTEDLAANGLSDWWEMHWFGNTNQEASGDFDSDGLNNSNEYVYGTCPTNTDTDADGMLDGWEIQNGMNPRLNDAAQDPDNDGLSNLQEYQHGTNPNSADTDGDGIPDKWELDNGLNPLVNDASLDPDGDGAANLDEYRRGTDPAKPDEVDAGNTLNLKIFTPL